MTSPIYSIMQLISIHEGYGTDVCIDAARLYCMLFIMFFLYFAELCIWNFLFFKTKVNCKTALCFCICVFVVFFFKIYNKGLVYDFLRYHNIKTLDTVKCIILWKCTLNKDTKYYYKIHIIYLHWSAFWGKRSKADDITKIHGNTSKRLWVYHSSIF